MLHYKGDITAMDLGEAGKSYIMLYAKKGSDVCFVPFKDLVSGKVRYVKYVLVDDNWLYFDLVDSITF